MEIPAPFTQSLCPFILLLLLLLLLSFIWLFYETESNLRLCHVMSNVGRRCPVPLSPESAEQKDENSNYG